MAIDSLRDQEVESLAGALTHAFRSSRDFRVMAKTGLGLQLFDVIDEGPGENVAFDLIDWAEKKGRLEDLIVGALKASSGNPKLRAFASELLLNSPGVSPRLEALLNSTSMAGPSERDLELGGLTEAADAPEIQDRVGRYAGDIRDTSGCAHKVGDLKKIHDLLDHVRHEVYEPLRPLALRIPAPDAMGDVARYGGRFATQIAQLTEVVSRPSLEKDEFYWLEDDFPAAAKLLNRLLREPRAELLSKALIRIHSVIERDLPDLEARLREAVNKLDLPRLVSRLREMRIDLARGGVDEMRLEALDRDIETLVQVAARLASMTSKHHQWQRVDARLNLLEASLAQPLDDVADRWSMLESPLAKVHPPDAPEDELGRAIAAFSSAVEARDQTAVWIAFGPLATELRDRFMRADNDLLAECETIRKVGDRLAVIVEKIDA